MKIKKIPPVAVTSAGYNAVYHDNDWPVTRSYRCDGVDSESYFNSTYLLMMLDMIKRNRPDLIPLSDLEMSGYYLLDLAKIHQAFHDGEEIALDYFGEQLFEILMRFDKIINDLSQHFPEFLAQLKVLIQSFNSNFIQYSRIVFSIASKNFGT